MTSAASTSEPARDLIEIIHLRQDKSEDHLRYGTWGILDYLTVAIFVLAPSILSLTGFAVLISYALAAIHLAMTLLTDMPLGAIKFIPMRLHALVEFLWDLFLW